jgi:hypothetical protein
MLEMPKGHNLDRVNMIFFEEAELNHGCDLQGVAMTTLNGAESIIATSTRLFSCGVAIGTSSNLGGGNRSSRGRNVGILHETMCPTPKLGRGRINKSRKLDTRTSSAIAYKERISKYGLLRK